MSITIGSNNISSDGGNTTINFYRSGNNLLRFNNVLGKSGEYPSFTAACTDSNWRYSSQLGGNGSWRASSTWTNAAQWVVNQRAPGPYGFNTSNSRYYAPVAGYYMFGLNMYHRSESNNSQGYTHVNFAKNGSLNFNASRHGHSIFGHGAYSEYSDGVTMENLIFCNAGDYVEPSPYWSGGGRSRIYCGHLQFFGHLIP